MKRKHAEPTCLGCGCTESKACDGGCHWMQLDADTNEGVCSLCAASSMSRDDVVLLTPRWTENVITDPRQEPLCTVTHNAPDWFLTLRIDGRLYPLQVREGEPEGDVVDIAPGVKAWVSMKCYGLEKLGPGVWRLNPSLFVPDELHAFLVLRDVPEPAPFAKPLLFSASGDRL